MIHVSETFALTTIEDFLTEEDVEQLNKIMDAEPGTQRAGSLSAHITAPDAAQYVLQQAVERALPAIRNTMPSVAAAGAWDYAELAPGDYVHVHLDGIPDPAVPPRRIGRMGVTIRKADEGGQFYVATSSSPGLWTGEELGEAEGYSAGTKQTRQLEHVADGAAGTPHHSAPTWVESLPKTRWTTDERPGVAIAYGAQLMHGVTPVVRGTVRKFVVDLFDTPLD